MASELRLARSQRYPVHFSNVGYAYVVFKRILVCFFFSNINFAYSGIKVVLSISMLVLTVLSNMGKISKCMGEGKGGGYDPSKHFQYSITVRSLRVMTVEIPSRINFLHKNNSYERRPSNSKRDFPQRLPGLHRSENRAQICFCDGVRHVPAGTSPAGRLIRAGNVFSSSVWRKVSWNKSPPPGSLAHAPKQTLARQSQQRFWYLLP